MIIWITKNALTKGIFKIDGEIWESNPNCVNGVKIYSSSNWFSNNSHNYWGKGKDWHMTESAAVKRANAMRIAKIASLKKQIAKLKNMKFGEEK